MLGNYLDGEHKYICTEIKRRLTAYVEGLVPEGYQISASVAYVTDCKKIVVALDLLPVPLTDENVNEVLIASEHFDLEDDPDRTIRVAVHSCAGVLDQMCLAAGNMIRNRKKQELPG